MNEETPKTVTFQITNDESNLELWASEKLVQRAKEKAHLTGEFAIPEGFSINNPAWEKLVFHALEPVSFGFLNGPHKALTSKQKKARKLREKKRLKAQKAHNKAVKEGAYCDSDY